MNRETPDSDDDLERDRQRAMDRELNRMANGKQGGGLGCLLIFVLAAAVRLLR